MPNTVPASAPALPNVIPFPRAADERFLPIIIDSNRVLVSAAENKALRDAVGFLALDHDELVAMASAGTTERLQELRWCALGIDLTASRLSILVDLLAEARHRLATVREVARG
jgi:hypothetical protein